MMIIVEMNAIVIKRTQWGKRRIYVCSPSIKASSYITEYLTGIFFVCKSEALRLHPTCKSSRPYLTSSYERSNSRIIKCVMTVRHSFYIRPINSTSACAIYFCNIIKTFFSMTSKAARLCDSVPLVFWNIENSKPAVCRTWECVQEEGALLTSSVSAFVALFTVKL